MKNKNQYLPDYNVPVFEFIDEYLETYNWTHQDLIEMSGIDRKTLNKIIKDEINIDEDTAQKLSDTLGLTEDMWIKLGDQKYKNKLK